MFWPILKYMTHCTLQKMFLTSLNPYAGKYVGKKKYIVIQISCMNVMMHASMHTRMRISMFLCIQFSYMNVGGHASKHFSGQA